MFRFEIRNGFWSCYRSLSYKKNSPCVYLFIFLFTEFMRNKFRK